LAALVDAIKTSVLWWSSCRNPWQQCEVIQSHFHSFSMDSIAVASLSVYLLIPTWSNTIYTLRLDI